MQYWLASSPLYATLFLLIAVLTYSLCFLSGAVVCYGLGFRHSLMAKKIKKIASITATAAGDGS